MNMRHASTRRIILMAEFEKGQLGGGESVVLGLFRGLIELGSTTEKYIIVTSQSMAASIREFLVAPHEVICRPSAKVSFFTALKKFVRSWFPKLGGSLRKLLGRKAQGLPSEVPVVDQFLTQLAPDIIHYLYPLHFARGPIATVYTVYDQNYEHLPELFDKDDIEWRRKLMTAAVTDGKAIVTMSEWVAEDVCRIYPKAREKIHVVKCAPYISKQWKKTEHSERLPQKFVLYPAVTYSHKNHLNLIKALSYLNQQEATAIGLLLTGPKNEYWNVIEREIKAHSESLEVRHLGYVSEGLLADLYDKAAIIVFPSVFEGVGLPLLEAISTGKQVCCSDIPVFREYGGDYPNYFDPNDIASIAAAIRETLASRSTLKIPPPPQATWRSIARAHRAIYRNVIEQQLFENVGATSCRLDYQHLNFDSQDRNLLKRS